MICWNGRVTDTHHRVTNDGHAIQSCQAIDLVDSVPPTGLQAINHLPRGSTTNHAKYVGNEGKKCKNVECFGKAEQEHDNISIKLIRLHGWWLELSFQARTSRVPAKKAWHEMESNEMVHHSSFGKHHGGRIDYPSPPAAPCDRSRHRLLWAVRWASWKGRSRPRPRGFWSKCTSTRDWTIHPCLFDQSNHRFSPLNRPFGCWNLVTLWHPC